MYVDVDANIETYADSDANDEYDDNYVFFRSNSTLHTIVAIIGDTVTWFIIIATIVIRIINSYPD